MKVPHRLLARSPLQPAVRRLNRHKLRVLAYHAATDAVRFEQQLDHVLEHYHPIALDHVLDAAKGRPLPSSPILLTFDDGHTSWIENVAPAMQRRNIPGVVFVVAGVLDSQTPYWWEEVEAAMGDESVRLVREMKHMPDEMRMQIIAKMHSEYGRPLVTDTQLRSRDLVSLEEAGLEVGNHTMTHPILDRCDHTKIHREVFEAKEALEEIVGHSVRGFAYPNGNTSEMARMEVMRAGHGIGFLFDHKLQTWPPTDPLQISRIRVNADDPIEVFSVRVSGLHPRINRLRGGR